MDVMDLVYTPSQLGNDTVGYVKWLKKLKDDTGFAGVPLCLPLVDDVLLPGLPGEARFLLGRPGMGKTTLGYYQSKAWADAIRTSGRRSCAVYVTIEQIAEQLNLAHTSAHVGVSVEDIRRMNLSPAQIQKIEAWNRTERAALPMFVVGFSMARRERVGTITVETVGEAVLKIEETFDLKVELVTIDYLQLMAPPPGISVRNTDNKVIVVGENAVRSKQWAQRTSSFWSINCQAVREVDSRDHPVPDQGDGAWTSNIEQVADSVVSVVRPSKYIHRPKFMAWLSQKFKLNTDNRAELAQLALVYISKQREGAAGVSRLVTMIPQLQKLEDVSAKYAIPDD